MSRSWRRYGWKSALAPLILLAIYIGFYWKLTLTRQYTWLDAPDFANQVLPWLQFQASEWHLGHFPAWDPHEWGGQSLIGQGQPGVVYPLNWILFLLPLKHGSIRLVYLHWYFVLIHYMGGLFCYLACRDLKRSRAASLLAGTAFGITGWMGDTQWPQMLNGAVWAPLVFLFLLRVARGERVLINGALAGASLGAAFLSGHHQIPIYITLAAGGVWIYCIVQAGNRKRVAAAAVLCGVFLVLVSAVQILPAYEYGKLSVRWVGAKEPVGWDTPVPYSVHETYSLYPSALPGMLLPGIARNANAYIAPTLLALALLAVIAMWQERMVRILAGVALGGIILSLGGYAVFHGLIYAVVPMVDKARSPSFAIFIFHLGVTLLAAYATDFFLQLPAEWVRRVTRAAIAISVSVFAIILTWNLTQVPKALDYDRIASGGFYGLLLAALLAAWRSGLLQPRSAVVLAMLLVMMQSGLENTFYLRSKEQPSEYLAKMSLNTDLVEFIHKQPDLVRAELDDQEIPYNFNDWRGIDTFNGYLASLTDNINRVQGDYRARMVFGVNLWIGKKPLRPNQQEVFTAASGLKVYRNPEAFPRAWIVHEAQSVARARIPEMFQNHDLQQLRRLIFLPDEKAPELQQCTSPERVRVSGAFSSGTSLDAELGCRGMVILGDAYYPGWIATVDGRPARIYEADGVVRGVVTEAGRHRIEMRYRPRSVLWGGVLSLFGAAGALALVFFAKH